MNKTQGLIFVLMMILAGYELANNPAAKAALANGFSGKPADVGALFAAFNTRLVVLWIVAFVVLLLLADVAPTLAGWIAVIIFVGAVLQRSTQSITILNDVGTWLRGG